jgi:glycosyltransferase involved in cell wall biosynthesis
MEDSFRILTDTDAVVQKVAFVTGTVKHGGSTIFLLNLGNEFVRRGIECRVYSFEKENPLSSDFRKADLPLHCEDNTRSIFEDRVTNILCRMRDFGPDTIIANLGSASFEILRYCRGIRRIGVVHSDDPRVYDTVARYTEHLDLLAVVSERIEETLTSDIRFSETPIKYLPLGVPMEERQKGESYNPSDRLEIVYLGRLDKEAKRVHLFPEIARQLENSGISFRWTICGEGPDALWLIKQLERHLNSGAVRILHAISYAAVPIFLRNFTVFLLTSDYEGLPLTLLEAMGQGLVPVVSDLPSGIREVVNQDNGLLVPVNEIDGYAKAIISLAENRPELLRMSSAARSSVAERFSTSAMADRWLEAIRAVPFVPSLPRKHLHVSGPLPETSSLYFCKAFRPVRRCLLLAKKLYSGLMPGSH